MYKRIKVTANSEACVVFVMGFVIHNPLNIFARRVLRRSLRSILVELERAKPDGFLTYNYAKGNPALLISYWKDYESLLTYARDKSSRHFPAWYNFNEKLSNSKAVGIWHEIYCLPAGSYSGTYRNSPVTGIASFAETQRLSF